MFARFSCIALFALAACGTSGGATTTAGDAAADITAAADAAAGSDSTPAKADSVTDTVAVADAKASDEGTVPGDIAPIGGDTVTPDIAGGTPIPLDQLEAAMFVALCTAMNNCSSSFGFASLDSCKVFFAVSDDGGPTDMIVLAKAGKVKYDPVQAGKCLAAFTGSCSALTSGKAPLACQLAFQGTIEDGQPCDQGEVCKSYYCKKPVAMSFACPGVCAQPLAAGGACQSGDACKGDLLCIGEKCTAPTPGKAGDACSDSSCGPDLYCKSDNTTGKQQCTAKGNANDPCEDAVACKTGLTCGMVDTVAKCVAQAKLGDPCKIGGGGSGGGAGSGGPFANSEGGPCLGTARCVTKPGGTPGEGVCAAVAKVGEPCIAEGQCFGRDTSCADFKDGKGTCKLLPAKGAACLQPNFMAGQLFSCLPPFVCDATKKVCVDPPTVGQECMFLCAAGLNCNQGKCMAKAKSGESCQDASCIKGLECIDGKCGAPVCK